MNHSAELGALPFSCILFYSHWDTVIITNKYISKLAHNSFFHLKGKKFTNSQWNVSEKYNKHPFLAFSLHLIVRALGQESGNPALRPASLWAALWPWVLHPPGSLFPNGKIRKLKKRISRLPSGLETMEINIQVMGQIIFLHLLISYHFLSISLSQK